MAGKGLNIGLFQKPRTIIASPGKFGYYSGLHQIHNVPGSGGGGGTGFFPAGRWIAAKQPMIQIFPRPDTETNSYARHHRAYYDGVNSIQYEIPLGVAFGAFPYVFELIQGPPGMTIEATTWNTSWMPGLDAHTNGYGRIVWTPQSAISSSSPATVEVLVTDQQNNTITITYTVWTEGAYDAANNTGFIFVDNVNGSDSNNGTISAPLATFGTAGQAGGAYGGSLGTTGTTSAFPQAILYVRGLSSSSLYSVPLFSDNSVGAALGAFQVNCTSAPCAILPYPGDPYSPTFDATGSGYFISTQSSVADFYLGAITATGYDTSARNCKLINITGKDTTAYRQTIDGLSWTNSGYGAVGNDNATMMWTVGSAQDVQYIFASGLNETNRQAGLPGNNMAGCDWYSVNNGLLQYSSSVNIGSSVDAAWYIKSEVINVCLRGCLANYSSYYAGWGQGKSSVNSTHSSSYSEICYCLFLGSPFELYGPAEFFYPWGPLWVYRCSLVNSSHGLISSNLIGAPNQQTVTTASTGGTLVPDTYYYGVTALGTGGGETNVKSVKSVVVPTGTSTNVNTVPWTSWGTTLASGQRVYRGINSSSLTEYVDVSNSVNLFTDDGTQSWTSGSPPSSTSAWSPQGPYVFDSNAVETSYAQPSGENVQTDNLNLIVPSGLFVGTGSNGTSDGALSATYSAYLGLVGAQIA